MEIRKMNLPPAQAAEDENLRATVVKQKEKIENQKTMIQYLAAMTDVYIPEEEVEEDVQNFIENEENV